MLCIAALFQTVKKAYVTDFVEILWRTWIWADGAEHPARAKASAIAANRALTETRFASRGSAGIERQANPFPGTKSKQRANRYDGCRESLREGKRPFFSPIFFGQEAKKIGPPEAECSHDKNHGRIWELLHLIRHRACVRCPMTPSPRGEGFVRKAERICGLPHRFLRRQKCRRRSLVRNDGVESARGSTDCITPGSFLIC